MSCSRLLALAALAILIFSPALVSADPEAGKNVDGARAGAERLVEEVGQRCGDLERVVLLTSTEQPEALAEEEALRAACARLGIACETRACAGKAGLVVAVRSLRGQVDLIVTSGQDLLVANRGALTLIAHTTPLVSFAELATATEQVAGGY